MLAAGGEVLLERLPAAGKGGQGVVWQLQELSEQAVRDIWRVRVFQREKGEEKKSEQKKSCRAFLWLGGQDREDSRVLLERGEKQRSFLGGEEKNRAFSRKREQRIA